MEYKARIEVAIPKGVPNKTKGDLLEDLAEKLLRIQQYKVVKQLRITGTELDLLCEHRVNRRNIYVECKAYRNSISADVLTKLLGTVHSKEYQEGWLISTGPLSKDAKGFQHEWENKPTAESQKLSIYPPEMVIEALILARIVKRLPYDLAVKTIGNEDQLGDPTLLITEYGVFWTIACLEGGVPVGVLVYSTETGDLIKDHELLRKLSQTDTSQCELNFEYIFSLPKLNFEPAMNPVIEVEHGETWTDYRPARPEDFVGRKEAQEQILHLLKDVRNGISFTRVFAVKGDSGMGKSSLIAKLRNRVRNQHYSSKFYIYAVDVRASTDSSYILWSVLECLRNAAELGFGTNNPTDLKITNSVNPFESPSIKEFLTQLEQNKQVVCLVFDQFEELYSKPEMFGIFEATQRLLLSAVAAQSNLVLGFAWKTDSTVQQDHPAYYLWHRLADHRMEVELGRFTSSEASKAISIFQKELGEQLRTDLRRQLTENNQGYPWLLKKLCIHVYDTVRSGISQSELVDKDLDVESLFDKDLQELSTSERTCLKMIAESSPADWYEVLDASDQEVIRGLQGKRLIIRSGDRLNLYWDIFREYVLTQTVPSIALSYLPGSSIRAMLKVGEKLNSTESKSFSELGKLCSLSEKTIVNVIRDLKMFGIATVKSSKIKLAEAMETSDQVKLLQRLRHVLQSHALTMRLSSHDPSEIITTQHIIDLLKQINPTAMHKENTWKVYAEKMGHWLSVTGYLVQRKNDWVFEDQGKVNLEYLTKTRKGRKSGGVSIFLGETSPARTIECLDHIRENTVFSVEKIKDKGYRNAINALRGLGIIKYELGTHTLNGLEKIPSKEIVWDAASKEKTIQKVMNFLKNHPTADGKSVGKFINREYKRDWSKGSEVRVGNSLRQWTIWVYTGIHQKQIPKPPGRIETSSERQMPIFENE